MTLALDARTVRAAFAEGLDITRPNPVFLQAITLGMQKFVLRAQRQRFSGKGPFPVSEHRLGVRSGRLRRAIHDKGADSIAITTTTATGYLSTLAIPVEYFAAHEWGFRGPVSVRAHQRKAYEVKRKKQTRTSKNGRAFTVRANRFSRMEVTVRAHSRQVDVPERAPMRTAISELAEGILVREIQSSLRALSRKSS